MKMWLIGGTIVGLLGLSLSLAIVNRSGPESALPARPAVVAVNAKTMPMPAAIAPIQPVVEVANIDSLLDPPAIPLLESVESGPVITRVGYEEATPARKAPVHVKPIPKAKVY